MICFFLRNKPHQILSKLTSDQTRTSAFNGSDLLHHDRIVIQPAFFCTLVIMKRCLSTVILVLSIYSVQGQNTPSLENQQERVLTNQTKELIVGSWIAEGASFSDRIVFENDGSMNEYSAEDSTLTYNWQIQTGTTPSGTIIISTLLLQNLNDLSEIIEFEVDTITEEEMVLVFDNGIGLQRNRYFKN